MKKRCIVLFLVVVFALGGLSMRVLDISGRQLAQAAERQASTTITVGTARGTIYDSELRPLVNRATETRVGAMPSPEAVSILRDALDYETMELLSERIREGKPVTATVESLKSTAAGMMTFSVPVRYGESILAPHVIGYMNGDGVTGMTGAELVFDDILSAASGKATVTYSVDATGSILQGGDYSHSNTLSNAKAGVVLTIDADIQKIAENAARANMTKGAVVVMEPDTGRIAAMVSLPDYQPGTVAENLNNPDSPLLNRAVSNYNFGSIFKIVTTAAALESGLSTAVSYECNGKVEVGGVTFHCHHRLGHGLLSMPTAFAMSCNPYYIRLAQRTGAVPLYQQAVLLGFDRAIYLADGWKTARAVLPSEDELQSQAALANLSIGQGALLATPVHAAQLVGAVVNGGQVVRPTLLKGTMDAAGQFTEEAAAPGQYAFSEETAATIKDMMFKVLSEGTGKTAQPRYPTGAKTGTAETGWVIEGTTDTVVQGWIAGFYPAEQPQYVIVVLVEDVDGSGGKTAPVFKEICNELYYLLTHRENVQSAGLTP